MAHRFAVIVMHPEHLTFEVVEDMPVGESEPICRGGEPAKGKDYTTVLNNTINRLLKDYHVNEFELIRA